MRRNFKSLVARVAAVRTRPLILAGDGVSRRNMRDRLSKAIIASGTALLLAASAPATAEPAAAQWRGGHDGGWGWQGSMAAGSPWAPPEGASAPSWSGYYFDDSCWQVRPIYSVSGAWLDNRRVNVCFPPAP